MQISAKTKPKGASNGTCFWCRDVLRAVSMVGCTHLNYRLLGLTRWLYCILTLVRSIYLLALSLELLALHSIY